MLSRSNMELFSISNGSRLVMSGNSTGLPADMIFNAGHRVQIVGYSVLMTFSALENLFVLILLCLRRPMSRMNRLLISLTVSDLLVTFLTMPLEIAWSWTVQWLADDFMCKTVMVGRIFGLYSSSFNLVAISIDRFCIIMYPFTTMTSADNRVRWSLIIVWTLSAICSLPQAVVFRKQYHPDFPTYGQCVTFDAFPTKQLEVMYHVFVTLMSFIVPLILFCIFYGRLWCFIRQRHIMTTCEANGHGLSSAGSSGHLVSHGRLERPPPAYDVAAPLRKNGTDSGRGYRSPWHTGNDRKHTRENSNHTASDYNISQSMRYSKAPNIYMRAKSKSFKMAVTLVIVFLVCWVPYYLVSCWFWFDKEFLNYIDPRITRMLFVFAVSQSCLNPIVTGIFCLRLDKKLAGLSCWRHTLGKLSRPPETPMQYRQPSPQLAHGNGGGTGGGGGGYHNYNYATAAHGAVPGTGKGNNSLFTNSSGNRSVRAQRRDQFV